MELRWLSLLSIFFVLLTACGQEPSPVLLERSYLSAEEFAAQLDDIRGNLPGEVLDDYQWQMGEEKVYTVLSSEFDAEGYRGLFLRHYRVGDFGVELRWTYQDTIKCGGANAGATFVQNTSPSLRPDGITGSDQEEFILRYQLGCAAKTTDILAVVDARSGTPNFRMEGDGAEITGAEALIDLPEDTIAQLLAYWQ
jgi:hypothetical protein